MIRSRKSELIHQPVFTIMPIGDKRHVARVFDFGIAPALAFFGFEARRIDNQAVGGLITEAILRQIEQAYFIIADLSFGRPNCYYELGYAHAKAKPVLLLKNKTCPSHFDVQGFKMHDFDAKTRIGPFVKDLVPQFLLAPDRGAEDTRNGQFGRTCLANNYRLTARITKCTKSKCYLNIEVISLNKKRHLTGRVTFYLHVTYHQSIQHKQARNNRVLFEDVTAHDGPSTVGVVVQQDGTRLELDLATIPGARKWWYREAYRTIL